MVGLGPVGPTDELPRTSLPSVMRPYPVVRLPGTIRVLSEGSDGFVMVVRKLDFQFLAAREQEFQWRCHRDSCTGTM